MTTRTQFEANSLWGLTETTVAEKVTDGVYALRGWGIASSYAIEAPDGWIIVDSGDSTRAATEMREKLEQAFGRKIKVAAILVTHWHYAGLAELDSLLDRTHLMLKPPVAERDAAQTLDKVRDTIRGESEQ